MYNVHCVRFLRICTFSSILPPHFHFNTHTHTRLVNLILCIKDTLRISLPSPSPPDSYTHKYKAQSLAILSYCTARCRCDMAEGNYTRKMDKKKEGFNPFQCKINRLNIKLYYIMSCVYVHGFWSVEFGVWSIKSKQKVWIMEDGMMNEDRKRLRRGS